MSQALKAGWDRLGAAIAARLMIEGATSLEDSELTRCLYNTCAPNMLFDIAQAARDAGIFSFLDVLEQDSSETPNPGLGPLT